MTSDQCAWHYAAQQQDREAIAERETSVYVRWLAANYGLFFAIAASVAIARSIKEKGLDLR